MKKIQRLLALVLSLILALSLAVPAMAATEAEMRVAQILKMKNDEKSHATPDTLVYPYAQTFGTAVLKGEVALLEFKLVKAISSGDLFDVIICRGSADEVLSSEEPVIVEERFYKMSDFHNGSIAITWKADSRYSLGEYTLLAVLLDPEGNAYEQDYHVVDLYVVSKEIPATKLEIYKHWNDQMFQSGDSFPEFHYINSTVCYEMYALPLNNTSDRTITVTSSRPDVVYPYVDAGLVYLEFRGLGKVDISITYGNLKGSLMIYSISDDAPTKFETIPTKTELCVGMMDALRVDYAPTNIPVSPEWYTSDPSVAAVKNGVVTAVGAGTVTISANLSGKSDEVIYTVKEHAFSEEPIERERTATKPAMIVGHCSLCDQDVAVKIIEQQVFTDTDYKAWYADYVDAVYDKGIMNGTSDTTFAPDRTMSRAELVTVLYRIAGSPEVTFGGAFTDVPDGQWYSDAVTWAAQNKVVNGVGNGRFAPADNITREQIATILYRYTKTLGVEMTEGADLAAFPDWVSVSGFAQDAMAWAVAEELITGTVSGGVTTLAPLASASRAQLATMIARYQQMFQ